MNIKLVTFDLDDTLWDNLPIIVEAEADMVNWLQERVSTFRENYNRSGRRLRSEILQQRPQIRYDLNKVRFAVLEKVLSECQVSATVAYELSRSALGIFHGLRNKFRLIDHAEEVLDILSKRYMLASVTNGTADVGKSPLGQFFEISISAAHVLASKPNPSMFLVVLSQAGALPHEAVHVGDHPVDDVECANSIGMNTIQFHTEDRGRKREVSDKATGVVNDLRDIPTLLEKIAET